MALITAHLKADIILVVTVCSDRYILPFFHPSHTPFPTFSPSLVSLVVSVHVKHHVYLLTYPLSLSELVLS